MKFVPVPRSRLGAALGLAALLLSVGGVRGAGFAYTNGELIACFRVPGGATDLVVNLGPAAGFEGRALGASTAVTNLVSNQLWAAFPSWNGLTWSVLGAMRGNTNFPQYPLQTVWVTSPSPARDESGPVWKRQGPFTQGAVASQIEAIGAGAVVYGSQQPGGANNTTTGVAISSADPNAYNALMTDAGNLAGTFPASVENTTPEESELSEPLSRSVLYRLGPATGADLGTPGRLLGYFDFRADGSLTFTAGPPPGRIAAVERRGDASTVSFPTAPDFSYRLRFAGQAGLTRPFSEWAAGGEALIGDGTVRSLSHTDPDPAALRFYAVEILP